MHLLEARSSRLEVAADKLELYELVVSYCRATDRRDVELMRELYHPDAIDDHGSLFYGTGAEFIAFLPGPITVFSMTTHHITNAMFEVSGDYAEGESYLIAGHVTREKPPRNLLVSGRYLDKFERRGGKWRFSHRTAMLDWANMAAEEIVKLLPPKLDRAGAVGTVDRTDPSYHVLKMFGSADA
jgi:hypothetical protein